MQLSEQQINLLRELLDRVEYDPASPTQEKVHKALEALDGLCAQADAPPVDFFPIAGRLALELECLLMDTQNSIIQSKWWDSALEALQQYRDSCDQQVKAILSGAVDAGEASAPGLSDEERKALDDMWKATPGAALTRASAATVAEPSDIIKRQAQMIAELIADRDSWIEAHARLYRLYHEKAAQQQTNQGASHEWDATGERCLKCGDKDWFAGSTCSEKAAQQQAEPGADERAAFEVQASEWGWDLRREANDPNEYLLASTAAAWGGWQARATQSGQRAGMAEEK